MNKNTRFIVEAGVMLALAFVLSHFKLFEMPQGGSVTLAAMLPRLFISFRWGVARGVITGVIFGILQWIFGGYVIGIIQGILDYPLAFGCMGIAGIASKAILDKDSNKGTFTAVWGAVIATTLRYACHVASGVIFFYEYAGEQNPLLYSLGYNSFLFPDLAIAVLVLAMIWEPLSRMIPKPASK